MKTFKIISALLVTLSINSVAQVRGPREFIPRDQPHNNSPSQNNNNQTAHWGNGWNNGWNSSHSQTYVSMNFGFGNPYSYNNYYGNGYSIKRATLNSIRSAGQIINQAVAFDSWSDIYSPILAKAIRHYNYAQQLYWWGNYQAAYNHAERAGYLASYSLQYFQNPNCGNYNNGYYEPDPYSDPNNPYYRTDQAGNKINQQQNSGSRTEDLSKNGNLDKTLPESALNDRQLIRNFDKSEMKEK
jgi:hypothetical protein